MAETANHSITAKWSGYRSPCNEDVQDNKRVLRIALELVDETDKGSVRIRQTETPFEITQVVTSSARCVISLKPVNSTICREQISKGDFLFGHSGPKEDNPGRCWIFYLIKE